MKIVMELENFTQASSVALSKNSQRNLDFRSDMISPTTSDILIASSPQEHNTSTIFTIEEDEISNIEKNPDRNKIRQSKIRRHSCPRKFSQQRDGRNRIRFSSFDAASSTSNNSTNSNAKNLQSCPIFTIENEVSSSSRMNSSKIIKDLGQSKRRHSCPHDLNHQHEIAGGGYYNDTSIDQQIVHDDQDEDETNINIVVPFYKEWNRSQEIAFYILCTFSVVIGIALFIILIVLKCL